MDEIRKLIVHYYTKPVHVSLIVQMNGSDKWYEAGIGRGGHLIIGMSINPCDVLLKRRGMVTTAEHRGNKVELWVRGIGRYNPEKDKPLD